jgi:polysaccharide export outer membrane protein
MQRISPVFLLTSCLALVLGGCATNREVGLSPNVEVTNLSTLPPPTRSAPYAIGAHDKLDIAVFQSPALTGSYITDEAGGLTFPLVGRIPALGLTPQQLAVQIQNGLRGRYLVNPQVTVNPTDLVEPSVSVGGEVAHPGTYPASTSQTLLRAVNNAGGLGSYANSKDVLVLRESQGQHYIGVYNLAAIQRGNYDDPNIYPGDVIAVGDSPQRRLLATVLQIAPVLTSSLILLDRTIRGN